MLVFGPGRFAASRRSYIRWLLRLHVLVCLALGAGLAIGGLLLLATGWRATGGALVAAGALLTPILLYWLARRVPYMDSHVQESVRAGVLNLLVVVGTLALFRLLGWLTPASAFVPFALSGATASAILFWQAWSRLAEEEGEEEGSSKISFRSAHRRYVPWATGTAVAGFVPGQVYYLILPIAHGLTASAALKALLTTVGPIMQATAALSVLLLPAFVRASRSGELARRAIMSQLILSAGCLVAWLMIGLLGAPILEFLYNGRYTDLAHYLWVIGGLPLLSTAVNVGASALRALERPKPVFGAYLTATVIALALGIPLTMAMGLKGAVAGLLVGYGVNALVIWTLLLKTVGEARHLAHG